MFLEKQIRHLHEHPRQWMVTFVIAGLPHTICNVYISDSKVFTLFFSYAFVLIAAEQSFNAISRNYLSYKTALITMILFSILGILIPIIYSEFLIPNGKHYSSLLFFAYYAIGTFFVLLEPLGDYALYFAMVINGIAYSFIGLSLVSLYLNFIPPRASRHNET